MGGMQILDMSLHMQALGNPSQAYHSFSPMFALRVGDGSRFWFREDSWIGTASFMKLFPHLYFLSSLHNAPIVDLLCAEGDQYSWNLHFSSNLNDSFVDDLTLMLEVLAPLCISSFFDKRLWNLDLWAHIHVPLFSTF